MADEISEKDKQAVALRSNGHTYNYIADKLGYENPAQARDAIGAVLKRTSVALLTSADEEGSSTIYEVTIRLTATGGDPRVSFRVRQLLDALYETEAIWEREMAAEENATGPILQEPTTFSVSRVVVDNAPQTGKHVIFPAV